MILSKNNNLLALLMAVNYTPNSVDAHGYLKTPRSRNYYASVEGVWSGGSESDPSVETCPQCLNIGGTEARCGLVGDHNYDLPPNFLGGIMPATPQGCYKPGADIVFESVLTAHHMGHFAFKACPISHGEVPTQECFDANPLTFLEDELYGANPDPLFPERAYIPRTDFARGLVRDSSGAYLMRHRFHLPVGLSGDLVLIQWHYVTGNSCKDVGYDTYDWPDGFYPGNLPTCTQPLPEDGRGVPEQFWNCAELTISNDCEGPDVPSTSTTSTTTGSTSGSTTNGTGVTVTTSATSTTSSTTTQSNNQGGETCAAATGVCGPNTPCGDGLCCSRWGYCGTTEAYCGACCQNGNCWNNPSPPSPTPPTPAQPTTSKPTNEPLPWYTADHGEDSRVIAYLGNWQSCPTDEQVDAYSHLVVAFTVSYMWDAAKNQCDTQCNIGTSVPVCNNANNQALVDKWRSMGKKIILSFGGAGMGGSWSGDNNNCWDYCFGKEEQLSDSLVSIVNSQNFDGIDIDYEYCYDVNGLQSGKCAQRSALYSDNKAQTFLDSLTSKLRVKLDALQVSNGYNRGRYEITHAPMDIDVSRPDSKYYQILKNRRDDLDFLMPQMYNGVTRPVVDGVEGVGAGSMSSVDLFGNLANDMFDHEPHKVVFGFCISDCSYTGSNANGAQAVQVMSDLKSYNNGEFGCNGGAFFWVAQHDVGGAWSDVVLGEVSAMAGCSNPSSSTTSSTTINTGATVTTTSLATSSPSTASPTSAQPTKSPTTPAPISGTTTASPIKSKPTFKPTSAPMTRKPTAKPTSAPITPKPTAKLTSAPVTSKPTAKPSTSGSLVLSKASRCGVSELDARETCGNTCSSSADCASGEWCWGVHDNYCDSVPKRIYENPVQSNVWSRCGVSEIDARTFCGVPCSSSADCSVGTCFSVHSNYCDSPFTTV